MKSVFICLLAAMFILAAPAGARDHTVNCGEFNVKSLNHYQFDDTELLFKGDDIIFRDRLGYDEEVRFTPDYELFVNGDRAALSQQQQQQVREFYDGIMDVRTRVKEIVRDGVRIGLKGAKLGLKACGGVLKMLLTDYDEDDLDHDLELEAEKLEAEGRILEDRADEIEQMVNHLEEVGEELHESVPELRRLEWLD